MISIVAVTCVAIYLREIVSFKGKTKINKDNKILETEIEIENKKEKEPPEK